METWVGLFRNGFCVVHDLELSGQSLFGPIQPYFPQMKVMNACIAPLQAAAVYFNLTGGAALYATSTLTRNTADAWEAALKESSATLKRASPFGSEVALSKLHAEVVSAKENYWVAWCLGCIGFGFTWLMLNSMKIVFVDLINVGLILMEVALVFLLVTMCDGVRKTWARASASEALAAKIAGDGAQKFLEGTAETTVDAVTSVGEAMGVSPPSPPWPAPAASYLASAYVNQLELWKKEVVAKVLTPEGKALAIATLGAKSHGETWNGWLDLALILLNVLAFFGYLVFPMTYLFSEATLAATISSWPGNEWAEWAGNLLGDVAWTIEPALVLIVRPRISSSVANKTKALLDVEKKGK